MEWRDKADKLNRRLHSMAGAEPCESACTHWVTGGWTLVGLANVAARADDLGPADGEIPQAPQGD